jgi:hypothetical protein
MRKEFQLTEEQYQKLLDASKPTPAMWDGKGNYLFGTPYENAMRVWRALGSSCGFDPESVQPVEGKSNYYFTAELLP